MKKKRVETAEVCRNFENNQTFLILTISLQRESQKIDVNVFSALQIISLIGKLQSGLHSLLKMFQKKNTKVRRTVSGRH